MKTTHQIDKHDQTYAKHLYCSIQIFFIILAAIYNIDYFQVMTCYSADYTQSQSKKTLQITLTHFNHSQFILSNHLHLSTYFAFLERKKKIVQYA